MGVEAQDLVGWLITIALAVIGWLVYKLNASVATNNQLLKDEIKESREEAKADIAEVRKSYKNMGHRLDDDIKTIRASVVFTDVFGQHEKLEDMREKNFQQMYNGVTSQLSAINKKIDTLIEAALNRTNGG